VARELAPTGERSELPSQPRGRRDRARGHPGERRGDNRVAILGRGMGEQQPLRRTDVQRQARADARRDAGVARDHRGHSQRLVAVAHHQFHGLAQLGRQRLHHRTRRRLEVARPPAAPASCARPAGR
jgi:hypothetical protein